MPAFQYKALDPRTGQKITNTVNGITKKELYDKLKKNGLVPIEIQQALEISAGAKTPVKRHRSSEEILKDLSPEQVKLIYRNNANEKKTKSMTGKSKRISQNRGHKVKTRDIISFTQQFLLLNHHLRNSLWATQ